MAAATHQIVWEVILVIAASDGNAVIAYTLPASGVGSLETIVSLPLFYEEGIHVCITNHSCSVCRISEGRGGAWVA